MNTLSYGCYLPFTLWVMPILTLFNMVISMVLLTHSSPHISFDWTWTMFRKISLSTLFVWGVVQFWRPRIAASIEEYEFSPFERLVDGFAIVSLVIAAVTAIYRGNVPW